MGFLKIFFSREVACLYSFFKINQVFMTSFIFPGQGSQYIGMCKDFYNNFKLSKMIFEEIQDYTSIPIRQIIFEDKMNQLNLTQFTQICIFTASMSIFKVVEENMNIDPISKINMLGHSLGEYTALAASKKISIKDASLLLKIRGELMNHAIEPNLSGMAALIGLDSKNVENIIKINNLDLHIANDNSPQQVVISGMIKNIEDSKKIFLDNFVKKFVLLNVSSAFHSPIMEVAQKKLEEKINEINFVENNIFIISNYNAKISNQVSDLKLALTKQMANRVRWVESINTLSKDLDTNIVEIGPGKVLSGLVKKINRDVEISNINSIDDIKK